MDQLDAKSFTQSRTILWLLSALAAKLATFIAQRYGVPLLPADVQTEIVGILQMAVETFVIAAIAMGMYFRMKATAVIDRWRK